jgi:hypothetical protein
MGVARYGNVRDVRGRIHLTALQFRHQELRRANKKRVTKTLSGGVHGIRERLTPDTSDDGPQRCGRRARAGRHDAIGLIRYFLRRFRPFLFFLFTLHAREAERSDRLEIAIANLEVSTGAEVDVRGTLLVDRNVPVGFQQIKCRVRLGPAANVPPKRENATGCSRAQLCRAPDAPQRGAGADAIRRNPVDGRSCCAIRKLLGVCAVSRQPS